MFMDKVYSTFFGVFGAGKAFVLVDFRDLEQSQLGLVPLSKYGTSFKKRTA
jgi:hypothetical protein